MRSCVLFLAFNLTVGLLVSEVSDAESRAVTEVPHFGMSPEALEQAYIESYEQSGFRLESKETYSLPEGPWTTVLVFQLKSAPEGPNAPGTTLIVSGSQASGCQPCELSRQTFRWPDVDNPDKATFERGWHVLVEADTAALAKVRQRLGVSLSAVKMSTP